MRTAFKPITVIAAGRVEFRGRQMLIQGWSFNLQGRQNVPDWQRVYMAEIVAAVAAFIAAKGGQQDDCPIDPVLAADAERATAQLLARIGAPKRRRGWWPWGKR